MKELSDNEIRIIGAPPLMPPHPQPPQPRRPRWLWWLVAVGVLLIAVVLWWCGTTRSGQATEEVYFDQSTVIDSAARPAVIASQSGDTLVGVTRCDTVVNDIPMVIYTPHNLHASLHVGELHESAADTVLMALQAADLRADNMQIVSAFVLRGELLARGTAKLGFCAIIGREIVLGVDEATPYFERAMAEEGDFFRQYPLVANGKLVENRIKNKAQRRALVALGDRVVVAVTRSRESLHDFAQALVDIGATTAINLVGSRMVTGWINLGDSIVAPDTVPGGGDKAIPQQVNYIVWTK